MRSKWVARLMLLAAISAGSQEYKLALPGYNYEFPRDYFNHEEYQTEWWYYTGNLVAKDGHRFGFELTFFRQGISRETSPDPWFVKDLWMAHFAFSDVTGQRFYHEERLNRAGPGLAGVDEKAGLVWNGNWRAQIEGREHDLSGVGANFAIGLKLSVVKAPVIQGQNGVSQNAEGTGHASHYFSLTRLQTTGEINVEGKTYSIEGTSWMDHEFFTGAMAADETGWDWLSVQLEDGSELMLYRLRHRDGSVDPYSSGSYVDAQGTSAFLTTKDYSMTPAGDNWTSAQTKASYPLRWHVSVAKLGIELNVTTPLREQELVANYGPSYWEGAVDVDGQRQGRALRGVGYLEMTGYAKPGKAVIPQ
jgi:predicted secreted hydrolase